MKTILTLALAVLFVQTTIGQLTKLSDLEKIKSSKLIVATSDNAKQSKYLFDAAKEFWTLSVIVDSMPYDQALKKVKEDESYLILTFGSSYTVSTGKEVEREGLWDTKIITIYKTMRTGLTIQIMGKDKYKPITRVHIPDFREDKTINEEVVYFGVAQLESMLRSMEEKGYKNNMQMRKMYNENSAKDITGKTLLIPEGWLEQDLTPDMIKEIYPYPYQVVSYEIWKNAILQRTDGFVYPVIAPYPAGEAYAYPLFFTDCKSGRVKAVYWPTTTGVFGVTLSGSNSAYITKFSLGKLTEIINTDMGGK